VEDVANLWSSAAIARPPRRAHALTRGRSHERVPGLDALRGLAVTVVLLFHAQFGWMVGGYLGVSLFFTLSGFLITGIVLRSLDRGAIDLPAFWSRRARRLLPAAMVCVAVVVVAAQLGAFNAHATAVDGIWSLLYVANWRFIVSGQSYANLFAAPSPLLHYWSLAIEEQYYVVFPLVAWLCCRTSRPRAALTAVLVAVLAWSIRAHLAGWGMNRMYYGTDVRAGEIAVGALLAVLVTGPHMATRPRWLRWAACVAQLPVLVIAVWVVHAVRQTSPWLYHGGLLELAVCWAILILGAVVDVGPMRLVAQLRPLRWLGTISYGVYLIHWPLFLLIHPTTNLYANAAMATTVTLVVAAVSYRVLERPIRYGVLDRVKSIALAGAGTTIVAGTAVIAIVGTASAPAFAQVPSFNAALPGTVATASNRSGPNPTSPTSSAVVSVRRDLSGTTLQPVALPALGASPPLRVLVIGDSTGSVIGHAIEAYAAIINTPAQPRLIMDTQAEDGCALADADEQSMTEPDEWAFESSGCRSWARRMAPDVALFKPNIVLAIFGPTQTADLVLAGAPGRASILDPSVVEATRNERDQLEQLAPDAWWVWATDPRTFTSTATIPARDWVVNQADRTAAWNELLAQFSAAPHNARIDLATWVLGQPGGPESSSVRPDGMHVRGPALAQLAVWIVGCLESIPRAGQLEGGST
jgi:peptidoglycan/LPS O-acetylase OafA/YrhL